MATETLELQIVTPVRHVLQETVNSVEVPGKAGYLGILPGHAPLITELGIGVLTYQKGPETHYLTIVNGYAEVLPNRVIVLAEVSEKAEEIDVARSRAAEERAKAALAGATAGEEDWKHASAALDRALIRLQVAGKGSAESGASQ